MKLEKWALIGEIVGGFAIIPSIVFVVLEIQSNTRSQNASTVQEMFRDYRDVVETIPDDIRFKSRYCKQSLTDSEQSEYNQWLAILFRAGDSWYEINALGAIRNEVFDSNMSVIRVALLDQYARDYWVEYGTGGYSRGFTEYIDAYIRENPVPDIESVDESCLQPV